jgi:2-polyprenyl-3-methyl-5-hydroxy-6-metoxy-1,4-benzoquinol methylase
MLHRHAGNWPGSLGICRDRVDLSPREIARAAEETETRGLEIQYSICDMRAAFQHHGGGFDLAISCDNSITHLLTDADFVLALEQMHACGPGGGCLLTVRDYDKENAVSDW